jgi:serine/threonine protein kinase
MVGQTVSHYKILERIGAGGMGVVYEVHDRARDEIVALKTLLRTSAADIYRLKREFRSLANVAHANLVALYELYVEGELCFFTMELVRGSNFVEYLRSGGDPWRSYERLVSAFGQLVDGISTLHRLGKLHRDIKPSNVLVTAEARVVILDFGLITELVPTAHYDGADAAGGTPAYMAPETGSSAGSTEAADWYAVGVTLFEALTAGFPFQPRPAGVLRNGSSTRPRRRTRFRRPDPPSAACGSAAPESALLTGQDALRRLGHERRRPPWR